MRRRGCFRNEIRSGTPFRGRSTAGPNDGEEIVGFEAGAANQGAIDIGAFLAGWFLAVNGLERPSIAINHPARTSLIQGWSEGDAALRRNG